MTSMPFQSRISAEVTLYGMSPYSQSRAKIRAQV